MTSLEETAHELASGPAPAFACASCHAPLPAADTQSREVRCEHCGFSHEIAVDFIRYDADRLLRKRFEKDWVLWKVLCNNGHLGYVSLKEGSLSLPDRSDVRRFGEFLERHMRRGAVLDVGCGPLELPGYLAFNDPRGVSLIGLDPMGDIAFRGLRVAGCAEFLPWPDGAIDTIVFATSLDHVCSLPATIRECRRVLHPEGRVVIWMADRTNREGFRRRFKNFTRSVKSSFRKGYWTHKYSIYPNGVVFYIPFGAIDPFHAYDEDPKKIIKAMKKGGFYLIEQDYRSTMEVNLCFGKAN